MHTTRLIKGTPPQMVLGEHSHTTACARPAMLCADMAPLTPRARCLQRLQRLLPDGALMVVARGQRQDP